MDSKYFVEILRKVVQERSVESVLQNLEQPPGRQPPLELKELSAFYARLNEDDRAVLKKVLHHATEMTFFGFLCVLDGVRAIENSEDKGTLELWYRKGEQTILLNDPDEDFLHDWV